MRVCDDGKPDENDGRTVWKTNVNGAQEPDQHDPNQGGIVPPYITDAIERHNEGKDSDSTTDERVPSEPVLPVDGGPGSGSDTDEEGSTSPATGREDDGDALHGERREVASEPDCSTEEV